MTSLAGDFGSRLAVVTNNRPLTGSAPKAADLVRPGERPIRANNGPEHAQQVREQKAWNSLNQLVSLCDEERRHFEAKRFGGPEIDHQFELRRLLDG
jgi:hypothetical protein